jgi:hypothetical protein
VRVACLGIVSLIAAQAYAVTPLTVPEATGYTRTSLYQDVVAFIHQVEKTSDLVAVTPLAVSTEHRMIPLVILSRERVRTPAELRATGKPAVLVMANIHAGEVEGKEACQMLIRDVADGALAGLLDHQVVLVIPIFNPDGNEKLGKNRHDNGPELAGVRFNGQGLDLNRDFTKLESPEVRGLVDLLRTWDPMLVMDMHTTDGSYHREPVSYAPCANANGSRELADYMWRKLFPEVAARLRRESGYASVPYGEFVDDAEPSKGWIDTAVEPRYGTNYVGLRNRLSILDENYAHADFKTRVLASFAYAKAVLEFTSANAQEIAALVRRVDHETAASFFTQRFVTEATLAKLADVTVKGWEFTTAPVSPEEKEKYPWRGNVKVTPTDVPRDYTVPYLALAVPKATVSLPHGYVVLPGHDEVVHNLQEHGVIVERLEDGCRMPVERFVIEGIEPATRIFQGHVRVTLTGHYEKAEMDIPAGSAFVDMRQPLARLVAVLLEPTSVDSLAAWGFLDRAIAREWSTEPAPYPVLRVAGRPPAAKVVEPARD